MIKNENSVLGIGGAGVKNLVFYVEYFEYKALKTTAGGRLFWPLFSSLNEEMKFLCEPKGMTFLSSRTKSGGGKNSIQTSLKEIIF